MSDNDSWYRSSNWSEQDQKLFFDKIKRTRGGSSRSQYAKIKAISLIETMDSKKIDSAIELLNHSLKEFPSEFDMDTDATNEVLGDAYRFKKDFHSSISYYEKALTWGNSRGSAYWEYPEMIVAHELTDLYDQALAIVNRNAKDDELILHYHIFVYHAVRACVLEYNKKLKEARQEAKLGLEAAGAKTSVLSYHPTVGLVDPNKRSLISKLRNIVNK